MSGKKILMVLSSHPKDEATGMPGGWYFPEALHPLKAFQAAGHEVTFASPKGGAAPMDPASGDLSTEPELQKLSSETLKLSDVNGKEFNSIFFVGGFGVMYDLPNNEDVQRLTREVYESGGLVGAVCHGPVALVNVKLSDGSYLVNKREVVAFTNGEEEVAGLVDKLPKHDGDLATCEDLLTARGGIFKGGANWACTTAHTGRVYTGQNPASAGAVGKQIADVLSLDGSTVHYFNLPGRAGAVRLMLAEAGVAFEDHRVEHAEWPALKPTTPWGSLPYFTLPDGKTTLAQSLAIQRYVGKHTGHYPTDALAAAQVDMILDVFTDIGAAVGKAGAGLEKAEKEAARAAACEATAPVGAALGRLEAFIGAHGSGGHVVGDSCTIADFQLFVAASTLVSGFWDGVPKTLLNDKPNIQAVRKHVGSLPAVQAFYEGKKDMGSLFLKSVAASI